MASELKNYLSDSDGLVYEFLAECDSMASAKFVTAERKISGLLMLIAASTVLHKIVARAARGYDFATGFQSARIKTGQVTSLLTPVMRDEQIAFAINILYAFDSGAVKFREFLEEYYFTGSGVAFAFAGFVRSVIMPLRRNVESAFLDMCMGGPRVSVPYSAQLSLVFSAISQLKRYVNLEPAVTSIERDELLTFVDGIKKELEDGNTDSARNMFYSLRNIAVTLPLSRSFFERESELDAAFSEL